jgi:GH24 family phage-related lysozyme (muramidase)
MITAFDLIRSLESFSPLAYHDGKTWAIGFGSHYIDSVKVTEGMMITISKAEQCLMNQITDIYRSLRWLVKKPLTHNQAIAIVSFCYNVGTSAFGSSTMLAYINEGEYDKAAGEFDLWTHSDGKVIMGLVKRRAKEKELFLTPDEENIMCNANWITVTDYVTGRMMRIQKDKILGYVDMKDGTGGELILDGFNYLGIKELSPEVDKKVGVRVS